MKLLAVDGNSILNRAFYGIKLLSAKDGTYTNGIYGFLTILLRLQAEVSPDACAIAFDMRAPTFRHRMYEGYKAQRKGMPEELAMQLPLLKELLACLGYRIVEKEGFEADDLLGTLARGCCSRGQPCVIATGDRDSFQLVDGCVTVRLASTKGGQAVAELIDEAAIRERYGVEPRQLIDVKALMGDASDNVPGVPGVGEKTALALIQRFGSLDGVYENLDDPAIKAGVRAKLQENRELAYLSRDLVTVNCEAPVETNPGAYKRAPVDNAGAYRLMARLELFSLMGRFDVTPQQAGEAEGEAEENREPLEIVFGELPEELYSAESVDVLFTFEGNTPAVLCAVTPERLYLCDEDVPVLARELLSAPVPKRVSGVKALHHFALENGFEVQNIVFDAEIAGYILNPTASDYSISRLAAEYGAPPLRLDNILGLHSELLESCARFSPLADLLDEKLRENAQYKLFRDIELPLARVLAEMEHIGFSVDTEGLTIYGESLDQEIDRCQRKIYELAGEEFNINSPKQLGEILFGKLGLPARKKTKTGYSTNAEVLESLCGKHEIIDSILQYRKVAKLKSTYVDGLLAAVGPDGRIHTSFQQTLTRTGRISSTDPNLQNIPIRTQLGSELRRFFRAAAGCMLVDADYSQIELRVLAHIAEDENMIAAFLSDEDIHLNTAAQVFDLPPAFVTPLMRSRAKAVNFGIVYGIGAFSLSQDIGVTVSEADSYIKGYLSTYHGVRRYMEDAVAFGTEHGYVSTLLQRRRYLPELSSSNRVTREFGKRVAMNTPIQGTAADIIKIAMVRVHRRLAAEGLKSRLILQVHDELIVESPLNEVEQAKKVLQEEMERAVELSVPLQADVHAGENWLAAK